MFRARGRRLAAGEDRIYMRLTPDVLLICLIGISIKYVASESLSHFTRPPVSRVRQLGSLNM